MAKVILTIEARLGATRMPGKVMFPLSGRPMLQRLVERARAAKHVHDVVVATTVAREDQVIVDLCKDIDVAVHRGPVEDIAVRLQGAARSHQADILVQLTGDNPLVDPAHIDRTVECLSSGDYAANNLAAGLPLGFDVRCFTAAALDRTIEATDDPVDRVHGSSYIVGHPELFRINSWTPSEIAGKARCRLTVDEPADYRVVKMVFDTLYPGKALFTALDVIEFLAKNTALASSNLDVMQKSVSEG